MLSSSFNLPSLAWSGLRRPGAPVVAGGQAAQPSADLLFAGEKRKVMTYNAHNLYMWDGVLQKSDKEMRAWAEVILREDPDVLAFQEAGSRNFLGFINRRYLQKRYPHIVRFDGPAVLGGGVAVLSKKNMRVVRAISHLAEQNVGRYHGKRDFMEVLFETETGYRFTLFNGHFRSPRKGQEESFPVRKEEAESAAHILRRKAGQRVLVVGDFNCGPNLKTGREVLDTLSLCNGADSSNALVETTKKSQSQHDPKGRRPTHTTGSRLDHMLASPRMLMDVVDAYVVGRLRKNPWKQASRHLPVVTVIEEPDHPSAEVKEKLPSQVAQNPIGQRLARRA